MAFSLIFRRFKRSSGRRAGYALFGLVLPLLTFLCACGSGATPYADTGLLEANPPEIFTGFVGTQFFGDSITCGYGGSNSFGGVGNFKTGGFAAIVQAALGGTYGNDCVGGDQILDAARGGRIYGLRDPKESENPAYFLGDSTNDVASNQSDAAKQANSKAAYIGALYWLGLPPSRKVLASTCTTTGFLPDDSVVPGMGMVSTRPGERLTCVVDALRDGAVVLAYSAKDGNAGAFTVTIDGTASGTYFCSGQTVSLRTLNKATSGVLAVRLPLAAGKHSIVITNQSPAMDSSVAIQWLGVPTTVENKPLPVVVALSTLHSLPTQEGLLINGDVGKITGQQFDVLSGSYDTWIQSTVAQAKADGLNVHHANTRGALGTEARYFHDPIHPNQDGYGVMARRILSLFASQ